MTVPAETDCSPINKFNPEFSVNPIRLDYLPVFRLSKIGNLTFVSVSCYLYFIGLTSIGVIYYLVADLAYRSAS